MRLLILGATGMLGNATFRLFAESDGFEVIATVRSERSKRFFSEHLHSALISGVDVENVDSLMRVMSETKPDVVINCIGVVKQLAEFIHRITDVRPQHVFTKKLVEHLADR